MAACTALNAALTASTRWNHRAAGIGLAKENEAIFVRDRATGRANPIPVLLPRTSQAMYLVQRIRDEAHRFAITYHRQVRSRTGLRSALDEVQGIGPKRKKELLRRFGSVKNIRAATLEELTGPCYWAPGRELLKSTLQSARLRARAGVEITGRTPRALRCATLLPFLHGEVGMNWRCGRFAVLWIAVSWRAASHCRDEDVDEEEQAGPRQPTRRPTARLVPGRAPAARQTWLASGPSRAGY
jgi:hypothetical protein